LFSSLFNKLKTVYNGEIQLSGLSEPLGGTNTKSMSDQCRQSYVACDPYTSTLLNGMLVLITSVTLSIIWVLIPCISFMMLLTLRRKSRISVWSLSKTLFTEKLFVLSSLSNLRSMSIKMFELSCCSGIGCKKYYASAAFFGDPLYYC